MIMALKNKLLLVLLLFNVIGLSLQQGKIWREILENYLTKKSG